MHDTAEVFRREVNLVIEPTTPSVIDVPDGFLQEWWLIFYDVFRASQTKISHPSEGRSYMAEQMMDMEQPSESSLRQRELNEQMIRELTVDSDIGLTIGGNLVSSMRCPLTEAGEISRASTVSQPLQNSLSSTPVICNPAGNLGDADAQKVGSSVQATPRMENIALNECGRKSKNSSDSEDGSSGMPGPTNCPSETSSDFTKNLDDFVKLSTSQTNENREEGRASSCNSLNYHTTSDADDSEGKMLV